MSESSETSGEGMGLDPGTRAGEDTAVGAAAAAPAPHGPYPAALSARLDEPLSRWLWLVKWLLLIPHFIVLAVLWAVLVVLTVVAGVAILFTGRYPRGIFDFNVGVLRWTWRAHFYGYGALGTDAYPPFTLADVPSYPARLTVAYPERLSRKLVLVKWLLALPHLVIVGLLAGSGAWLGRGSWPGLVDILVLVAGVLLLFGRRYPRGVFDLVLGSARWALRTVAYVGLMTDEYPPFRLDSGPDEPAAAALADGMGTAFGSRTV